MKQKIENSSQKISWSQEKARNNSTKREVENLSAGVGQKASIVIGILNLPKEEWNLPILGGYFSHAYLDMTRNINKVHYQHHEIFNFIFIEFHRWQRHAFNSRPDPTITKQYT